MLSWHFKNLDLSIKLSGREAWVVTPQDKFPQLQSPVETCFTPLHSKLVSLLGYVGLAGSYSNIKSHATPGSQFLCWCLWWCLLTMKLIPWWPLFVTLQPELLWFLNTYSFAITPLTFDDGISSRVEISQANLLHQWHPITVTCS